MKMTMKLRLYKSLTALVVVTLAVCSNSVSAGFISGQQADKDLTNVITGGTELGFDNIATGDYDGSFTTEGVTFSESSSVGSFSVVNNVFSNLFNTDGTYLKNAVTATTDAGLAIQVFEFEFSSAVSSFAFLFGASGADWKMNVFDESDSLLLTDQSMAATSNSNAGDYFGFTSAAVNIKKVRLSSGEDLVFFDNLTYSDSAMSPVPEPASLAMWGLAVVGMAVHARRRRAQKA